MISSSDKIKQHSKCHKVNQNSSDYLILESSVNNIDNECEIQPHDDPTQKIQCSHLRRQHTPVKIKTSCENNNLEYAETGSSYRTSETKLLPPGSVDESSPTFLWECDLRPADSNSQPAKAALRSKEEQVEVKLRYNLENNKQNLSNSISVTLLIDI